MSPHLADYAPRPRRLLVVRLDAFLPQPEPSSKRIVIAASLGAFGKGIDMLRVAAAEHDVVRHERESTGLRHAMHRLEPGRVAVLFSTATAEAIANVLTAVRQAAQLQRDYDPLRHERGSDASPQPEKEHAATVISAECLQHRIVDDADGPREGGFEIEAEPAAREIAGLSQWAVPPDCPRIAECDDVIVPFRGDVDDAGHHRVRRQMLARLEPSWFGGIRREQFDMRAADINHEHFHVSKTQQRACHALDALLHSCRRMPMVCRLLVSVRDREDAAIGPLAAEERHAEWIA